MNETTRPRLSAIVVDDDALECELIALLLEGNGFDVVQCNDAEKASLAIKTRHPSLLITDVNLVGKMDGIELAHMARDQHPGMRIIVISGNPPSRPLPDHTTFCSKPVYPATLLREATH